MNNQSADHGTERIRIEAKIEALRSERDFFKAIDMAVAADHCEESAIAWEGSLDDLDRREEQVCAWADYRKDFGVHQRDLAVAHKAFMAGWKAATDGDQSGALR